MTSTEQSQNIGVANVSRALSDIHNDASTTLRRRSSSIGQANENDALTPPMVVIGSINEDGLGIVSWWN